MAQSVNKVTKWLNHIHSLAFDATGLRIQHTFISVELELLP